MIDATFANGRLTGNSANPMDDLKSRFFSPGWRRWEAYDTGAARLHLEAVFTAYPF
jgi:hypothetical protein